MAVRRLAALGRCPARWPATALVRPPSVVAQTRTVTLAELAAAFGEMSTTEAARPGPSTSPASPAPAPQPPRFLSGHTRDGGVHHTHRQHQQNQRQRPEMKRTVPPAAAAGRRPSASVITLSASYAHHLHSLEAAPLQTEMENNYRRMHYGQMVQNLMELSHRLSRGGERGRYRYPDAVLEAALRCLTKMNLVQLEPDIIAALESIQEQRKGEGQQREEGEHDEGGVGVLLHFADPAVDFPNVLGEQLLAWLASRAHAFDAHTSIRFLHVCVHQRLVWCDAVLATLLDNILVAGPPHSGSSHAGAGEDGGEPSTAEREPLTLREFALFFDAMARCETSVHLATARLRGALRHQRRLATAGHNSSSSSDRAVAAVPATGAAVTVGGGASHPLYGKAIYQAMAGRLGRAVVQRRRELDRIFEERAARRGAGGSFGDAGASELGSLFGGDDGISAGHGRGSASTGESDVGVWRGIDPVSFFFLTRALGKLALFSPRLVPPLLPGMAAFLHAHPEQFLGVVLLTGRQENVTGDPVLASTLLTTLAARLRRREEALAGASSRGDDGGHDMEADDVDVALLSDTFEPQQQPQQQQPLSRPDAVPTTAEADRHLSTHNCTSSRRSAPQHQQHHHPHVFAVSIIDLSGFGKFLGCLCHQFRLALGVLDEAPGARPAVDGAPITTERLRREMADLCDLLLDDVHRGVAGVGALLRTNPTIVEETIEQILAARQLIAAVDGDSGCGSHHPLLLELTYAWMMAAASRRLPAVPSRRRCSMVEELQRIGVLERVAVLRTQRRGRYNSDDDDAQRRRQRYSSAGARGPRDDTDRTVKVRTLQWIMPMAALQATAPRVVQHIHDVTLAAEKKDEGEGAGRRRSSRPAGMTLSELLSSCEACKDRPDVQRSQKSLLVRHFSRASAAIDAMEE